MQSFLGFAGYYKQHAKYFSEISKRLTELYKLDFVYEMPNEGLQAFHQLRVKHSTDPLPFFPDWKLPFNLCVDAIMTGIGAALHQEQVVHDFLRQGLIVFISRQLKDSEDRYGASQLECLCLVGALEKLHCYLEGSVCEVSSFEHETHNRHMLRWQIAFQEYRGNMTIMHREGNFYKKPDGLSRWALPNDENNPSFYPEEDENTLTIMETHITDYSDSFFALVRDSCTGNKNTVILFQLLMKDCKNQVLVSSLADPWRKSFYEGRSSWFDGLIYHRTNHISGITIIFKDHINTILHDFHENVSFGHLDGKIERFKDTAWWTALVTMLACLFSTDPPKRPC